MAGSAGNNLRTITHDLMVCYPDPASKQNDTKMAGGGGRGTAPEEGNMRLIEREESGCCGQCGSNRTCSKHLASTCCPFEIVSTLCFLNSKQEEAILP